MAIKKSVNEVIMLTYLNDNEMEMFEVENWILKFSFYEIMMLGCH